MNETITSIFDSRYYRYACFGAALLLLGTGFMLFLCLLSNFFLDLRYYLFTLFLIGLLWLYYSFFSKSWKRIAVTPNEIVVYDVVFKKQITIPFAEITRVGTYRTTGGRFGGLGQNFVIEYKNDQSVAINEGWYENYNKLTMTIYYHKYGPGHGRERYLARHGLQS